MYSNFEFKKISELPAESLPEDEDLLLLVAKNTDGTYSSKKLSAEDFKSYIQQDFPVENLDEKLLLETDDLFLVSEKQPDLSYESRKVSLDTLKTYLQNNVGEASQVIPVSQGYDELYSVNSDTVSSEEDAAYFLRNATLGPTPSEISNLVSIGSKREWIMDQISGSYDNSEYSEWDDSGPALKPKAGWFGKVGLSLQYPTNWTDGQNYHWWQPGPQTVNRAILTAFIRNNPMVGGVGSLDVSSTYKDPRKSLMCKVTWALSKLIPVSEPGGGFSELRGTWAIVAWYGLLARHAFTNYADLLEEITYNVSMSRMLTHLRNQKSDGSGRQPDENYAREIMQLFTIGLYKLNIDGSYQLDADGDRIANYTNQDILGLSKVFTGLTRFDRPDSEYYSTLSAAEAQMKGGGVFLDNIFGLSFLDTNIVYGIKKPAKYVKKGLEYRIASLDPSTDFVSLGANAGANVGDVFTATKSGDQFSGIAEVEEKRTYPPGVFPRLKHYVPWYETGSKVLPNVGISIPEGTDPETNIRFAIEGLVNHPSCAPNVCKNLIKLSVTSNPSPGYISRVASVFRNNGKGVVGDMAAVWMAIFTDPEAQHTSNSSARKGRIRDGFEVFCNLHRSLDAISVVSPVSTDPGNLVNTGDDLYFNGTYQSSNLFGLIQESNLFSTLGTWPYMSPSVFSYYSLEYSISPAIDWSILVPEIGSLPGNTLMLAINKLQDSVSNRDPIDYRTVISSGGSFASNRIYFRSFSETLGDTSNTSSLVSTLDKILCGGTLSLRKKTSLINLLNTAPSITEDNKDNRVCMALQMIIRSPEFWVS